MTQKRNILGQKFNRLTAISSIPDIRNRTASLFKCDCGNTIKVTNLSVTSGNTKSCGCFANEVRVRLAKKYLRKGTAPTHGLSKHPLYYSYIRIKNRCNNQRSADYKYYGARGIKVCIDWQNDFLSFYNWALNNGWDKKLSIERVDNDKGYSPENCIWATQKIQARNTRKCNRLTFNGQTFCISEWAEKKSTIGLTSHIISGRIRLGWDVEKILTTPKLEIYAKRDRY